MENDFPRKEKHLWEVSDLPKVMELARFYLEAVIRRQPSPPLGCPPLAGA